MGKRPEKYTPDLRGIDGCETSFNHYIGWIKVILDTTQDKKSRVIMWRFAVVGMAFIHGVLTWGPVATLFVSKIFNHFINEMNQRYHAWYNRGQRGRF